MTEQDVRELFLAEADDEHVGPSSLDIDQIITRERRMLRRRRAVECVGLLAAARSARVGRTDPARGRLLSIIEGAVRSQTARRL